jgi:asparagine synthase (glutamine-hydrolysing)
MPAGLRRALGTLSTRLPDGMRGKDLLRRGSIPLEERYYGNARIFRDDELGFLERRNPDLSHVNVTAELYRRTRSAGYDDVTAMQYVDLFTWLRGDILVKADKMTMANSLELRVPFLDPEVFKVAGTLPVDQRVTRATTKYALRQALKQIVPPHVLNRRKLGFPVPTRHWLAEGLHDWARQIILESQTDEWLDKQQVLAMLAAHRDNQRSGSAVDYSRKLWTLLVFMVWHGIFVEERIKPEVPETVYPVRL